MYAACDRLYKSSISYCTEENFGVGNLANCKLFEKLSLPIFTDTSKMYLGYALAVNVVHFPNFLPIAFAHMIRQNFSLQNFSEYNKTSTHYYIVIIDIL